MYKMHEYMCLYICIYIYIYTHFVYYIYIYVTYIYIYTYRLYSYINTFEIIIPLIARSWARCLPVACRTSSPCPPRDSASKKLRHRPFSNVYNWGYSILWGCIKTYIAIFGKMNIHEYQLFLGFFDSYPYIKSLEVMVYGSYPLIGTWNFPGSWEIDLRRMFHIDFDLLESSICMYLLYIDTFHELDANFLWFGGFLRFGLSNLDTFGRTPLPQHFETCSSFNIPGTNHGSHFPSSVRLRVKLVKLHLDWQINHFPVVKEVLHYR